jgi:hypothetical protein
MSLLSKVHLERKQGETDTAKATPVMWEVKLVDFTAALGAKHCFERFCMDYGVEEITFRDEHYTAGLHQ